MTVRPGATRAVAAGARCVRRSESDMRAVQMLSERESEVLFLVGHRKIIFTRGEYRIRTTGSPLVNEEVQRLRALKLVVLARNGGGRVPPTRECELTEAGRAAVAELGREVFAQVPA